MKVLYTVKRRLRDDTIETVQLDRTGRLRFPDEPAQAELAYAALAGEEPDGHYVNEVNADLRRGRAAEILFRSTLLAMAPDLAPSVSVSINECAKGEYSQTPVVEYAYRASLWMHNGNQHRDGSYRLFLPIRWWSEVYQQGRALSPWGHFVLFVSDGRSREEGAARFLSSVNLRDPTSPAIFRDDMPEGW